MSEQKKKSFFSKRDLIEFGVIAGVAAFLYLMGWHTEVIGTIQRGLLATGIIRPDITVDESEFQRANYNMPLLSMDGDRMSLQDFEGKTMALLPVI